MVFPGRFSTGCLRCRQRKVKCDEGKPSCRRCAIYGKPCTGYTDQFHFRHSRNKSTATTSKTAQTSQTVATQPQQGAKSSSPQSSGPQDRRHSTTITTTTSSKTHRRPPTHSQHSPSHATSLVRAPEASYDQASLCYFVSRFVSPDPADGYPAHLSFLPGLYDGYRSGLLETATLSVAQMAAYNKFGGDKFKVQSYQNYGRAIRMLQDTIRLEDQATDDKVIAAILLLCTLKDVSGDESGDPNEHAPGLFYLIEKRGLEQLATSRGSELLYLALIRLQVYAFLHEDDTYVDPGAIATCWGAFDPLLRAMSLMSKTLSLRHQLLSIHPISFSRPADPTSPHLDYQTSVIQGCFETLDDFQTWDAEAASHWNITFSGRGAPTALGQVAAVAHYDAETACTIILIRSARLILLMSMIAYIDMAEWTPVLEGEVELVISDMLASVPHALGEQNPAGLSSVSYDGAAAVMIHQPMRLVASCAYATPEQLQAANDILARLNAGVGIRAAVGLSDDDLNRTSWAREQTRLRERIAVRRLGSPRAAVPCPSLSPVEVDMEASPVETESPPLLTPLSLDPPWSADVGCASY